MQRIEDVADLDPHDLRLVAVDIEVDLRRVGREGAEDAGQLRLLVGRDQEAAHRRGDVGRRLPLQRLEHILEPAGAAETDDRRQVERKDDGSRHRAESRAQRGDDRTDALVARGPLCVGFQGDDNKRLVRGSEAIDEVEADDRHDALHTRDQADDVLDLLDDGLGTVDRGALGQAHRGEKGALVLLRQKALRRHSE